jgi:hypothetical protein
VRLTALVLVVCAVQWLAATGAVAADLAIVAVFPPTAGHALMVVDVGPDAEPVSSQSASVTVDGLPQPTTVVPVLSDGLAVGLVVDASDTGRASLPTRLSGAARFILETPAAAHATVVADTTPPAVVAPLQQGPVNIVRALSAVQAGGARRTSDALTLAVRQLPARPTGPHVVVLYTSGPDAGGERAAHLAERLVQAHVVLVVISTARDAGFWSQVTRDTGGFLAPSEGASGVKAFDRMAALLRARYLLTFPTPARLPTLVSVQLDTGKGRLTNVAVVSDPDGAAGDAGTSNTVVVKRIVVWLIVLAGAFGLVKVSLDRFRSGRARRQPDSAHPSLVGRMLSRLPGFAHRNRAR